MIINKKDNGVKFSELDKGDVFVDVRGEYYMKTERIVPVTLVTDIEYINSIRLEDGFFLRIYDDTTVYKVNYEFNIK